MTLFGLDIIHVVYKFIIVFNRLVIIPIKVFFIRKKNIVKVAFIISDLGKWKTECLYVAMAKNSRINPIILVTPYKNFNNDGLLVLIDYLKMNGYNFAVLGSEQKISDVIKPDIIFYQEPYKESIDSNKGFKNNVNSLFCYVNYAFHTIDENWSINQPLLNFCWQIYYENSLAIQNVSKFMTNKGKNCIVTGLPITDSFLLPLSLYKTDTWEGNEKSKKRIIWAPHHTIQNERWICYSTFLNYCDYMINLAEKYKEYIQIAFKPHPILLTKLYCIWGKEKTDDYYAKWANGENTQLVLGDYVPLFMYSDAMIHDCGSFTVEYHYTKKPVMYLTKDEHHAEGLNDFGKMAFDLHYKGRCEEDIEAFINDVIEGRDEMKVAREKFYNDYLLPPDGNSASDNIIKAILGE